MAVEDIELGDGYESVHTAMEPSEAPLQASLSVRAVFFGLNGVARVVAVTGRRDGDARRCTRRAAGVRSLTIVSAAPASDGHSSHGVVRVAVGDHLADLVCGPARDTVRFRTFVWVDATTYEVVGGEIIGGIIHDSAFRLDPIHDAARAFRSRRGASLEP
jgi:hypothetical protein